MPTRTLGFGGWIVMSHIGWGGEQNTLYKVWKFSPSMRVLKPLGEARKRKPKGNHILYLDRLCALLCDPNNTNSRSMSLRLIKMFPLNTTNHKCGIVDHFKRGRLCNGSRHSLGT